MLTFPNAKINLGLNITEKRPDGYHNLETVFYPIPVEDALEITPLENATGKGECTLKLSGRNIEGNPEDNLVVKAYRMLEHDFDLPSVDEEFQLGLPEEKLENYASRLGADCAFFIRNRPTYAEGIGNQFSPIALSLKGYHLLLVKPDIFVSTREAFSRITPRPPRISIKEIIDLPVEEWRGKLVNDFEESVFPQFPKIEEIKNTLYQLGATYASMSGSGASVFGLFKEDVQGYEFGEDAFVHKSILQ